MKSLFFCVQGWMKELMHSKTMTVLSLLLCYISLVIPAICTGAILRFKMPDAIWNANIDPEKAYFIFAAMPILTEEDEENLKECLNSEYINSTPVMSVPMKTAGAKESVSFPVRGIDEALLNIAAIKGDFKALFQGKDQCYLRKDHLKDFGLKIGDEITLAGISYKIAGTYESDLIEHILIPKYEVERFMTGNIISQFYYFYSRDTLEQNQIEQKWYEFFGSKQRESETIQIQTEDTYNTRFQRFRADFYQRFGSYGGILCIIAVMNLYLFLRLKGQKELYHHALKRSFGVPKKLLFTTVLLDVFFYSIVATMILMLSLPYMIRFFDLLTIVELSPALYFLMFLFSFLSSAFIRGINFWMGQKQEVLALLKKEGGNI